MKDNRYIFVASLVLVVVGEIVATTLLPAWREYFFNGVEAKQWNVFISGMWYFALLMGVFAVCQGFKGWLAQRLGLMWREHIADDMLTKLDKVDILNPEQRITEDTKIATQGILEIGIEVVISASIVVALVGNMEANILWVGLLYVVVISALATLFHKPLVNTEKLTQTAEAGYRLDLTLRQPINFEPVKEQLKRLMKVKLGFNLFSYTKSNMLNIIPYTILIPAYFSGEDTFGQVMKGVSQFDLLVINATILIIMYTKVTQVMACWQRVQKMRRMKHE